MEKMKRPRRSRASQAPKRERKIGPAVVILVLLVVMSWGLLSSLRGDTNRIQSDLAEVSRQIEGLCQELREMDRQITALSSSSVIYANAIQRMGMNQVHLAGTIRVTDSAMDARAASLPPLTEPLR